jgi:two-component system sensor histidine kinase TctE
MNAEAMPRAGGSVFDRLRLLMIAVFVGGSAFALAAAWYFSNTAADEAFDQLLISAAVQIAETVNVDQGRVVVAPPDAAFETLALSHNDRIFYAVRAPTGRLLTGYPELQAAAPRPGGAPRVSESHFLGAAVRTVSLSRYVSAPGLAGWYSVVVAQTRGARHVLAWTLMAKTASLILLLGALGVFASIVAARRALRPLTQIEEALALREPHDVTPLDVNSPRETQALVDAINAVMGRLADRMGKLHKFVAVAAHQIRTPLAALTAQIELLESDRTAATRHARVQRIRHRVVELSRLTHQLLGHAMIVYRAEAMEHETLDLTALVRSATTDGAPMSLERDLSISFDAPETPVLIRGDPIGLKEGLTNLVHNAVVHGAPAHLGVRVSIERNEAIVSILDDGPGIDPSQWTNVLSPFTATRGQSAGAGLGLSIVHEVVQAHEGRLSFRHPPEGGFEVIVALPALAARAAA